MLSKTTVKYIQSLQHKKFRDRYGVFVAEGEKLVSDLIKSGKFKIEQLFVLSDFSFAPAEKESSLPLESVEEHEMRKISLLNTPPKVMAIFKQNSALQPKPPQSLVLLLDNIQDPGNLGTIIRTADWCGIEQIVCSPNTVEVYNPKVVQGTMGSIAHVDVVYTDLKDYIQTHSSVPAYAAMLNGEPISAIKGISDCMLVIGNEGKGVSEEVVKLCKGVTIPGKGKAESLNAAIATAVLLYAFTNGK
jgi:TrmH family RNA methyltransferase